MKLIMITLHSLLQKQNQCMFQNNGSTGLLPLG
ncbi:uncharacterized protein METZ01_LOCUS283833, partial [marine metagenome]